VFDLSRPFKGATPLKATLQAPAYRQGDVELPALDVSVARGADGSLVLALVNLDPVRPARVSTSARTPARGRLLTATTMDAHNRFDQPPAVVPVPYAAEPVGGRLVLDLPPMSIVVVTLGSER